VRIHHRTGRFYIAGATEIDLGKDIQIIPLGLLRERTMWPRDDERAELGNRPMCKSDDAITGTPGPSFPWVEYEGDASAPNAEKVPCDGCNFRKWSGETQPRCVQTWIVPALIQLTHSAAAVQHIGEEQVFNFQFSASGIKALEEYLKPYRDNGIPTYTNITRVVLSKVARNGKHYTIPKFEKLAMTSPELHPRFSFFLRQVREHFAPEVRTPKLVAFDVQQ